MGGLSGSGALPRVLLTGAGGGIGRCLHRALAGRYPLLRLVDRVPVAALHATDDVLAGDLRDPAVSRAAVQGIDCVVHLAGIPKVFGEALCRMYADKYAVDACCLRIGSFRERPEDARQLSTWIGHRDMVELVRCAIEAPQYGFAIVYGVSANARVKWHSPDAARIGYQPTQDAGQWAAELAQVAVGAPGSAAVRFHGGGFCANGHIDRDGGSDRGDRDG